MRLGYLAINTFIYHLENNHHRKINTLEENEILKAASSKYLLNDVIAGKNDPIYKPPHISGLNSKINCPGHATSKNLLNQQLQ